MAIICPLGLWEWGIYVKYSKFINCLNFWKKFEMCLWDLAQWFILAVSHPEVICGQRFQLMSGPLSSIPAKFYWFILFFKLLVTSFSCIRCSFEQNTRKLVVYLRNLSDNNNFLFLFFIFWDFFLGSHNVWTLPFSVWIRPCPVIRDNVIFLEYY